MRSTFDVQAVHHSFGRLCFQQNHGLRHAVQTFVITIQIDHGDRLMRATKTKKEQHSRHVHTAVSAFPKFAQKLSILLSDVLGLLRNLPSPPVRETPHHLLFEKTERKHFVSRKRSRHSRKFSTARAQPTQRNRAKKHKIASPASTDAINSSR